MTTLMRWSLGNNNGSIVIHLVNYEWVDNSHQAVSAFFEILRHSLR